MILSAASAFLITLALVPLILRLCERTGVMDRPGPLKIHARPIPRLGGIAIFAAVATGILLAASRDGLAAWPLFAALALIFSVGLLDDLRGVHIAYRLAAQIAAAALLWQGGWRLPWTHGEIATFAADCVLVVASVNAWNFLDGADGLAAGVGCAMAISYVVLPSTSFAPLGFAAACSLAAACAAFLVFNAQPARIFLGDSGSTLLGFLCAFLALDFARAGAVPQQRLAFPLLVAVLPLLDALRTVCGRLARGHSPFQGDRSHFYDLWLARGWTQRRVALVSWGFTAIAGAAGVAYLRGVLPFTFLLVPFGVMVTWIAVPLAAPRTFTSRRTGGTNTAAGFAARMEAKEGQ